MLTQARALELLSYDPATGRLVWREGAYNAGKVAGEGNGSYGRVYIDGARYKAHRVIWLMMTGSFPLEIDHANGVKSDNRFANLREANRSQNCANRGLFKNNSARRKGVSFYNGKYVARITRDGRTACLGFFDTPDEAAEAYRLASVETFGAFARAA